MKISYIYIYLFLQTLLVVDEKTDLSYNIAAEAAGGLVSARDFINLRHWGERDQTFFIAVNGASFSEMPPQKKYVRQVTKRYSDRRVIAVSSKRAVRYSRNI